MASNDQNQQQQSAAPKLCAGACGFYGRAEWQGYCSSCFKKQTASSPALVSAAPAPAPPSLSLGAAAPAPPASSGSSSAMAIDVPAASSSSAAPVIAAPAAAGAGSASPAVSAGDATPASVASGGGGAGGEAGPAKEKEVNRSRCAACKKKVGLTGFECRCGKVFCGTHRYQDQHACTFDYKTHDRSILEKRNEKVGELWAKPRRKGRLETICLFIICSFPFLYCSGRQAGEDIRAAGRKEENQGKGGGTKPESIVIVSDSQSAS
jgi:AN1-type zinc finger protein 5/6